MQTIILIIHVLLAIALIVLILVQHGKGADAGAAFGSGASSTVFGARGSANFLTKITTIIALIFFVTSISLAYFASNKTSDSKSLIDNNLSIDKKSPSETPDKDLPLADVVELVARCLEGAVTQSCRFDSGHRHVRCHPYATKIVCL